jgi:hypothetical protein
MVIETGEAAPPVNLRIAVPVFLVIFVVIPGAWDIVRSSCDHHSTLYFVNRGYITGLFGHTYSASTSDGSEIDPSSAHRTGGCKLSQLPEALSKACLDQPNSSEATFSILCTLSGVYGWPRWRLVA